MKTTTKKTAAKKKTKLTQPIYLVVWIDGGDGVGQIFAFCDVKEAKAKIKELERSLGANGEVGVSIKLISEGCIDLDWSSGHGVANTVSNCGKVTSLALVGNGDEDEDED
jgi:hypothetical protein